MKKLLKHRRKLEYLLLFLYFAVFLVLIQMFMDSITNTTNRSYIVILMVVDVVLFIRALMRLMRKQYKSLYKKIIDRFEKFARYLKSFAKKVAVKLGLRRNQVYIKGKDKIEFAFGEIRRNRAQEEKKQKAVFPKWKDLKNNRERVRFIYVVFLKKCIKQGFRLDKTMTPADIAGKVAVTPNQRRIFECYNDARYSDERTQVSDGVVKELLYVIKK